MVYMMWLIRVLQQWLSHTKKPKNPVLAQSTKMMELKTQRIPGEHLVFGPCWKPKEAGSTVNEGSSSKASISSSKYSYKRVNLTYVLPSYLVM